jgi:hypothetical protein
MAANNNFNTLIIDPRDQIAFKNFPGKVLSNAWSTQAFVDVVKYARMKGLNVIPEIKLLSHQKQLFGSSRKGLMFDRHTYNPENKSVYILVFAYLDEIINLIHPSAIHIGHDEINGAYQSKKLFNWGNRMLPTELFYRDVKSIYTFLKNRGVSTWMWGDMLISSTELPQMRASHLNGVDHYGRKLRSRLPKDIVICDWHYADEQKVFSSIDLYKREGFRVIGATFKNLETMHNFTSYAAQHGASGMIATTWFIPGHRSKKVVNSWAKVGSIIIDSGKTFLKDFPDEK